VDDRLNYYFLNSQPQDMMDCGRMWERWRMRGGDEFFSDKKKS
jgi:hypothetical protein